MALHRFKVGDVVEFHTQWPWATKRVRIVDVLPEPHEYVAVELDYYSGWAESSNGPTKWRLGNVSATVVAEKAS